MLHLACVCYRSPRLVERFCIALDRHQYIGIPKPRFGDVQRLLALRGYRSGRPDIYQLATECLVDWAFPLHPLNVDAIPVRGLPNHVHGDALDTPVGTDDLVGRSMIDADPDSHTGGCQPKV